MESEDRLDLFQVVREMVGQNGQLDVLEVLCHARLGEGWATLGEIVIDLQRMGKEPRRKSVAQHLSKLIENGWVQGRLITLSWYQYRLVREKEQLLKALAEEADKQQRLQAAQAALALEAVTSPPVIGTAADALRLNLTFPTCCSAVGGQGPLGPPTVFFFSQNPNPPFNP